MRQRHLPDGLSTPGSTCFGTWVKFPSLEAVELLGLAGFDFVVIDLEHSPLSIETAYQLIVGAQACGMAALVRVPDRSGSHIQRILDAGADGILVPQVSSPEMAQTAVDQMRFSPTGVRGMGLTSRAGGWGLDGRAAYLASGDDIVRGVQIEDIESLRRGQEFLAVDGLSALFVGLGDLTLSSGLAPTDDAIRGPMNDLVAAAVERGMPCGTAVNDAAGAERAAAKGFSFVMISNDASIFGRAASAIIDEVKKDRP